MKEKDELRRLFLPRRRVLEDDFIGRAGISISVHLGKIREIEECVNIAAFYPSDGEPDITGFLKEQIKKGKGVCFPRARRPEKCYEMAFITDLGKDFERGDFRIMEPREGIPSVPADVLNNILWLVPGVAFDFNGGRLGHGKGIFDRLLKGTSGIKIGICYDWQIVDAVPAGENDIKMDFIVTESGSRVCS
ncbi:MAG TPA: 5-formyltetrahydrofolate cyclo-ligase [Lentisphaeria bacterium]|nr:MAG: 5-formyltetrahydrofolate cyclo-ligase [Lentisphaerae bacterium GWF2_50_93]HCE42006.1 5-formyltetrahydrofolate cyclo-ligase [Lentisphaeria bacterium]